jgi:hypothetical protein
MESEEPSAIDGPSLEDNLECILGELFEVVSALETQPNDVSLLRRNADLAKRAHMSEESQQAMEMLVNVIGCSPCEWAACGWLQPLLNLILSVQFSPSIIQPCGSRY